MSRIPFQPPALGPILSELTNHIQAFGSGRVRAFTAHCKIAPSISLFYELSITYQLQLAL